MNAHYSITVYYGEGRPLFYVMDNHAPESEQPCVLSSHNSRGDAETALFALVMDEQAKLAKRLPVDLCEETAYGSTVRLPFQIRCF